ncbi:TadE/TadG family type IV pilus assembly protein [Manganibacter manganicus]|uniref:TadE-like domain-containing protein n=1 Tax=Manganibacter manganicus TaxID=1873176 RepID=A0A1V8RPT5_9HYPH|nr:TadE/TadG family type IV pilus assembly protein [Pseudaminobacter manganicus]OQM75178.1 hypothetical protein BFN67_19380 [Pseudaminobacter manganicus]
MNWLTVWANTLIDELSSLRKNNRGTSAVEFAFLAPLFLLMLLGMSAYGIYFGAAHSIQQLAADAARTAIAGLNSGDRQNLVSDFISHNAGAYAFVDPGKIIVIAEDSMVDPNQFVVAIKYDARNLPIWNLLSDLPMPSMTIARKSTIRMGGL